MKARQPEKDLDEIFRNPVAITEALRLAFEDALETHRRAGVPMVFWKDGKIVEMTAEEVLAERAQNGKPEKTAGDPLLPVDPDQGTIDR